MPPARIQKSVAVISSFREIVASQHCRYISPLRKGETIEVLPLATEDACERDMLVQIRWQGRKMAVRLSQLKTVAADEITDEAIGDCHYWVTRGYHT
jgi:hypothetical protein